MSRYDPKVEKHRIDREEKEYVRVHSAGSLQGGHRGDLLMPAPSEEQVAAQQREPVRIGRLWLYRDRWVEFGDESRYSDDEAALLVKRTVLREKRELTRARQEVETLERFGDLPSANRDTIPDEVRMFVWQRDGGRCVRCGSHDKLEFDHIIPVADGGSSTERNVQLLCESCNRTKGRSIT